MSNPVLTAKALAKTYGTGDTAVKVFSQIDLTVMPGERVAVTGVSGSGKSTLLHLLGGLDLADSGEVSIDGSVLSSLTENEITTLRNHSLGFVYQFHHLLPEFSAIDNVAMPLYIRRENNTSAREKALEILKKVGLAERAEHLPSELSGGERQRVALARALVTQPKCVLADEPTGNLDREGAMKVFDLMMSLSTELKTAFVIVTHDLELAGRCDTVYRLEKGALVKL